GASFAALPDKHRSTLIEQSNLGPLLLPSPDLVDPKPRFHPRKIAIQRHRAYTLSVTIGVVVFPHQKTAIGVNADFWTDLVARQGPGDRKLATIRREVGLR